ncbi:MAG: hypothetical protein ACYSWP_14315 [Planctomycetota bacterium]|jgi:hypothetical protein
MPIILLIFYVYVWYHWDTWNGAISLVFGCGYNETLSLLNKFFNNRIISVVLIAIAVAGCAKQLQKQKGFDTNNKAVIYWWDRRISKRIFYVRFYSLFFNLITVMIVSLLILKLSLLVSIVPFATASQIKPIIGHPDGNWGTGALGQMAISIAMVCVFLSGCGIVALLDHWKQGFMHTVGDVLLIVAILPAIWLLTVPLMKVNKNLQQYHQPIKTEGSKVVRQYTSEMQSVARKSDEEKDPAILHDWLKENAEHLGIVQKTIVAPKYLVDVNALIQLAMTGMVPSAFCWLRKLFKREMSRRK